LSSWSVKQTFIDRSELKNKNKLTCIVTIVGAHVAIDTHSAAEAVVTEAQDHPNGFQQK
jgi:hypothetical protein